MPRSQNKQTNKQTTQKRGWRRQKRMTEENKKQRLGTCNYVTYYFDLYDYYFKASIILLLLYAACRVATVLWCCYIFACWNNSSPKWKLFLENCLALESGPSMFITRFLFLLLSLFFFSSFSPCFYAFWMLCTDFKQLCFGILKECIRFQGHQLLNTIKQKQPFQSLVLEIIIITESHVCKYTHL